MTRLQPSRSASRERAFLPTPEAQDVVQAMGTWAGAFLAGLQVDDDRGTPSPLPRPVELAFVTLTEGAVLAGLLTRLGLETARETAKWVGRGLLELAGSPAAPSPAEPALPTIKKGRPASTGRGADGLRKRPGVDSQAPLGGSPQRAPAQRALDIQLLSGILPLLARTSPTPSRLAQAAMLAGTAGRSLPTMLRGLEAAALSHAAARDAVRERRSASRR
jgi:hypothetical protein